MTYRNKDRQAVNGFKKKDVESVKTVSESVKHLVVPLIKTSVLLLKINQFRSSYFLHVAGDYFVTSKKN